MNVKELIAKLESFHAPDAELVFTFDSGFGSFCDPNVFRATDQDKRAGNYDKGNIVIAG